MVDVSSSGTFSRLTLKAHSTCVFLSEDGGSKCTIARPRREHLHLTSIDVTAFYGWRPAVTGVLIVISRPQSYSSTKEAQSKIKSKLAFEPQIVGCYIFFPNASFQYAFPDPPHPSSSIPFFRLPLSTSSTPSHLRLFPRASV